MSDSPSDKPSERIPRAAIAVVIVGLFLTVVVFAIDLRGGGGGSSDIEWQVNEDIKTPEKAANAGGKGTLAMNRTLLSATPPNSGGQLIFKIGGVAVVDSGNSPTEVLCTIDSTGEDTTIARTPNLRAAFPRPSGDLPLQEQEVPEKMIINFNLTGKQFIGAPIKDVINRFTDTASPVIVDWDTDIIGRQGWIWELPEGSGPGPATLGYTVVFRTTVRPQADLECNADIGGAKATRKARAVLNEFPIIPEDAEVVETDPELDVE